MDKNEDGATVLHFAACKHAILIPAMVCVASWLLLVHGVPRGTFL